MGAQILLNFFKKEKSTKKTPYLKFVMNEYSKNRINAIGNGKPPNTTKRQFIQKQEMMVTNDPEIVP